MFLFAWQENFSISSVECSDDDEATSTGTNNTPGAAANPSPDKSTTSIRSDRDSTNLENAGTSSTQSNVTTAPITSEHDPQELYPTT